MNLRLDCIQGPIPFAHAEFRSDDYAFEYAIGKPPRSESVEAPESQTAAHGSVNVPKFLVIADTLTMEFGGRDVELLSLDAYTNFSGWQIEHHIVIPSVYDTCRVTLPMSLRQDDRISTGIVPNFVYSPMQEVLRIELGRGIESYRRVSSCLFVGSSESMVVSLVLTDLKMVEH